MQAETVSIVWGAIAGGVVTLAIEGLKVFLNRTRLGISAVLGHHNQNEPNQQVPIAISITNTGGAPVHVVRFGILRPKGVSKESCESINRRLYNLIDPNGKDVGQQFQSINPETATNGCEEGLVNYEELVLLQPGEPHSRENLSVPWKALRLCGPKVTFYAEDSLGKRWTKKVPLGAN